MIAFNPIVAPLLVDVSDTVEMRVITVINLADDAPVGLRFVGHDRRRPMQPYTLNRLVQKGFGGFRVPPRGEAEINHLTVRINGPPKISPFAADTDVGFIHVPVDAGPAQVLLRSLRDLWPKLLNPAIHGGAINVDPALREQIHDILIGQRVAQIPPHRAKDYVARKTVMLEWGFTGHAQPQNHSRAQTARLMQQSR